MKYIRIILTILLLLLNYIISTSDNSHINFSKPISILDNDNKPVCPPCFNCLLPAFKCYNYGKCKDYDGRCQCPIGFGGEDCKVPLCGSLTDGKERKPRPDNSKSCDCAEGWEGINCNLCKSDHVCDKMVPQGLNGTCYKGGIVVNENHHMCDVTNKKIVEMLGSRKPQVSLSCNRKEQNCNFQFWVDGDESFDCVFKQCEFEDLNKVPLESDMKVEKCKEIKCECLPGRFLCGQDNNVDISEFLEQEIKGPGKFACDKDNHCRFEEPAMNNLILSIFGDDFISLDCTSAECIHYSETPGFKRPPKPSNSLFTKIALISVSAFFLLLGLSFMFFSRKGSDDGYMPIEWDDESGKLMAHHVPTILSFKDICYQVDDVDILNNVHGVAKPGEVIAIMGASGAGKTSFLDILARRNKSGAVSGEICVNGKILSNKKFRKIVGYVDQEDNLMPTLTVYETILNSALLRLPRDMSLQAKKLRVLECMKELSILGIKDSRIGSQNNRGISGGEKRRVSIACEMVTSPAILFLDEPTSGLDAYNAQNVIECLVSLARNYKRTIVFTIHQPRSNIYALFDQLVLLADGWLVYSGHAALAAEHFENLGFPCSVGYNIADHVVDITQDSENNTRNRPAQLPIARYVDEDEEIIEEEDNEQNQDNPWNSTNERPSPIRNNFEPGSPGFEMEDHEAQISSTQTYLADGGMRRILAVLVLGFKKSHISHLLHEDLNALHSSNNNSDSNSVHSVIPKGFKKSSWLTQFQILSSRTFKNLYRDPLLMLTNYTISIILAVLCGLLYYQVTDDIPGFQNRMGLFFFMCALFGFSCLTSLQVFQPERILFMRERANGYYSPITYFAAKVTFDILPLRVIPPLLMGVILYPMVGLNPGLYHFLGFLLVLVLFNLTAASICLCLGILLPSLSLANLLCSLVMLFSMLFSGLFLNSATIPTYLKVLKQLSIFHYALEALLVNEMRFMQLKDRKFGYDIDIPAATILSTFGFDASAFWYDVITLASIFLGTIVLAYIFLHFLCKEKR